MVPAIAKLALPAAVNPPAARDPPRSASVRRAIWPVNRCESSANRKRGAARPRHREQHVFRKSRLPGRRHFRKFAFKKQQMMMNMQMQMNPGYGTGMGMQ